MQNRCLQQKQGKFTSSSNFFSHPPSVFFAVFMQPLTKSNVRAVFFLLKKREEFLTSHLCDRSSDLDLDSPELGRSISDVRARVLAPGALELCGGVELQ